MRLGLGFGLTSLYRRGGGAPVFDRSGVLNATLPELLASGAGALTVAAALNLTLPEMSLSATGVIQDATLPATQTVAFGAKTRLGWGGHPLNYGGTGYLSITSETNGSAAASTHFRIDDQKHLVPRNGATTTYGNAPPAWNGPYTIVVAEYSDSGLSSPTGRTSIVTVNIVANALHIREKSGAPTNADGTGSSGGHQLRTAVTSTGGLVRGDTIWCREGTLDPATTGIRIRPQASYSGTGVITIRSENADGGLDEFGAPRRKHGFKITALGIDTASSGDVFIPFLFKDIWFQPNAAAFSGAILKYNSGTSGWGVVVDGCRFEAGPSVVAPWGVEGVAMRGGASGDGGYIRNCTFTNLVRGIEYACSTASGVCTGPVIAFNDGYALFEDLASLGANAVANAIFEDNFMRDSVTGDPTDPHPDVLQDQGNTSGAPMAFGVVRRNIIVQNAAYSTKGNQGVFSNGNTSPRTDASIYANILVTRDYLNGIYLDLFDDPVVRFNTLLRALSVGSTKPQIRVPTGEGGVDGTFTHNLVNTAGIAVTAQSGTVVSTPNIELADNLPAYQAALPGWSEVGIFTREAAIAMATPALNGAAKNADGTYSGALLPNGTWNDGSVYVP